MKFEKFFLSICFILFSNSDYFSAQGEETFAVKFKIKNAGLTVDGFFSDYKAEILFNEQDVSKSKFYGEVKTSSINTGINMRDNHLRKKEYFDVENFPLMTFKSIVVSSLSAQKIKIIGDLTIKGISQKVVLNVDVIKLGHKIKFYTSLKINRRDFKVGGNSWTLSDDLIVFIQVIQ